MGPAVVGVSVGQVSLLISTMFASYLPSGSVSWLFYADRLMEFPTGLLGAALGTILLPSLVKHHTDGDQERYSSLLDWGLRVTLLLTLPAAVGLAICAVPLISTLFLRGAFGAHDLWQVREALLAYSLGLTGLIAVKILAPAYYARQDMRTPVRIAIFTLVTCQMMNAFLIGPFAHAGLALSTGLGACINAGLLLRGLLHRKIYSPQAGWGKFILKLAISLGVLSIVLWWLSQDINFWLNASSWQRVLHMILIMVAASVSYFGTLALLGFRLKDFNRRAA
jgi:putative peptidoglycan lipid II flippase